MIKLHELNIYLLSINRALLITFSIIISFIGGEIVGFIGTFLLHTDISKGVPLFSTEQKFLGMILIAPLLETLIFQFAIIEIARRFIPIKYACILSALIFGFMHSYNTLYIFMGIYLG